jgi:nicotinamide-nucleotide amidase
MKGVEIIAIGREILRGQTLDTNSHWLAKMVTTMGGRIARIVIPDDDVGAIVREIEASFRNGAQVIITTGGLGPTFDDKTLAAIAEAANCPLSLHTKALEFVTRRYKEFWKDGYVESPEITPAREKMAYLPQGAEALDNPVGAAPAVFLKIPQGVIFALPGVPKEMKAIFDGEVLPRLKNILGAKFYLEDIVKTKLRDESVLGEFIERVMKQVPGVYLKSKPTRFGRDVELEVTITAAGSHREDVQTRIDDAKRLLFETIKAHPTHTEG